MSSMLRSVLLLAGLACLAFRLGLGAAPVRFESVTLDEGGPAAKVALQWCPGTAARHPVILMLGALDSNAPPRLGFPQKSGPGFLGLFDLTADFQCCREVKTAVEG